MLRNSLKITLFLGVIYYLYSSGKIDFNAFNLNNIVLLKLVYAYILLLMVVFSGFIRLHILLSVQNITNNFIEYLKICYFSNFYNLALAGGMGTIGEDGILCSYLTKKHGKNKFTDIAATIFINRCCGLSALVIYAGIAMLISLQLLQQADFFNNIVLGYSVLLQALSFVALVLFGKAHKTIFYALAAVFSILNIYLAYYLNDHIMFYSWVALILVAYSLPKIKIEFIEQQFAKFYIFSTNKIRVFLAFCLSFIIHFFTFSAIYNIALALNIDLLISFKRILLASPPSLICNVIPLPANALGVGELVFDKIVNLTTTSGVVNGVMIFIMYRIIMYLVNLTSFVFGFVIGLKDSTVIPSRI